MKFDNEEYNFILDGLEDTLTRLKEGQIKESYDDYTKKVLILKHRIEEKLKKK